MIRIIIIVIFVVLGMALDHMLEHKREPTSVAEPYVFVLPAMFFGCFIYALHSGETMRDWESRRLPTIPLRQCS